jgi:hypothetical protein
MLKWLRGLMAPPETASLASAREEGEAALAEAFCASEFWFLSLPPESGDGIPADATTDEALAVIRGAAEALSERTSFEVFSYVAPDGSRALPLFTSQEAIDPFVQAYVNGLGKAVPFEALQVPGGTLAGGLGRYGSVVINPHSRGELQLSSAEVRGIIARAA